MSKASWTKWEAYQCDQRMGKSEPVSYTNGADRTLQHPYAEWATRNRKLYPEKQLAGNSVNRFKKSPSFVRYFENDK